MKKKMKYFVAMLTAVLLSMGLSVSVISQAHERPNGTKFYDMNYKIGQKSQMNAECLAWNCEMQVKGIPKMEILSVFKLYYGV